MEDTQLTELQAWFLKNKNGLWRNAALVMFGYIAAFTPQLKYANERADTCILTHNAYVERREEAAQRALFRRLENSDTTFAIGYDSSVYNPGINRKP